MVSEPATKAKRDIISEGAKMGEDEKEEKVRLWTERDLKAKEYAYDQLDSYEAKLAFLEMALFEAYGCDKPPPGTKLN